MMYTTSSTYLVQGAVHSIEVGVCPCKKRNNRHCERENPWQMLRRQQLRARLLIRQMTAVMKAIDEDFVR